MIYHPFFIDLLNCERDLKIFLSLIFIFLLNYHLSFSLFSLNNEYLEYSFLMLILSMTMEININVNIYLIRLKAVRFQ